MRKYHEAYFCSSQVQICKAILRHDLRSHFILGGCGESSFVVIAMDDITQAILQYCLSRLSLNMSLEKIVPVCTRSRDPLQRKALSNASTLKFRKLIPY